MAVGVAQNHYKYLRYDNTWADWQSGPYSQESLRAFRVSPQRRDCVDCHMPRGVRGGTDHGCPAQPATAAPNRDLRVEIFALRQQTGQAGAERLDAPLENRPIAVSPGSPLEIDVVLENRGIGHSFPAATRSGESVWLAFEVRDASGRLLFASPSKSDPSAHRYGQLALDREGVPLGPADKDRMVTTAYRRFIGAGESDVAHYRLVTPNHPGADGLRLHARLMRTQSADPASPETILAEHHVVLGVRTGETIPAAVSTRRDDPADAPRFYAYGVGLLQQGDNGRARRAFAEAILLAPREPLYLIGAARASLAEGDRLAARASLDAALRLQPDFPQGQAWLGTVLRETGQYREALAVLTPLSKRFPRDKQLWMEIGWSSLKTADNEQAADAFQKALAIDPDDAAAHYNLMHAYLRQRKVTQARREETIFHALQEDEPLRGILDPFYAAHPDVRMESQPVHEHVLKPLQRQPN
jgi:tetratricopeptide (TPR) repeat protein